MQNLAFSAVENQMLNFDFNALNEEAQAAQARIAAAASVADIKTEICAIWSKIKPFVKWIEAIPIVGKYVTILAGVLDSICGA